MRTPSGRSHWARGFPPGSSSSHLSQGDESPADFFQGGTFVLVLSCKVGQRIVIPTIEAEIALVAIKGKTARLGIIAPADVAVYRVEVSRQPAGAPCEADTRAG